MGQMNGMNPNMGSPRGMPNNMGMGGMNNNMGMGGMGGGYGTYGENFQNRRQLNSNPNQGGFQWRKPFLNPLLAFAKAVKNTPDH